VLHNEQAAYVIFGIGVLLSFGTYLVREDLGRAKESLLAQYHHAHEIPFELARISDPECQARAQELLAGAKRTITLLQQGFIPLDDTEFYLEGARLTEQATRRIKAVDPLTTGWLTRGALVNFYQSNLRALDRGVRVTRIFVASHHEFSDPEVQKVLLAQYRDDIDVRVAFRDELPPANDLSGRGTTTSCNFAIYDERCVIDVFAQPGKYYGKKTSEPTEVAKYLHLYDLIEHSAQSIRVEGDRLILAVDGESLAS
jgi:hypothetical protein